MFLSDKWKDYELIDARRGEKLERNVLNVENGLGAKKYPRDKLKFIV